MLRKTNKELVKKKGFTNTPMVLILYRARIHMVTRMWLRKTLFVAGLLFEVV